MTERAWLTPWYEVESDPDTCRALEHQLMREVGPCHVLFGIMATLLARRQDNDDCLFFLADGRHALVHLTWRKDQEPDPTWPAAAIFDSLETWAKQVMQPDNAEWIEIEKRS